MSDSSGPGSALYPAVYEFLLSQGLSNTARTLMKESTLSAPVPPADPAVLAMLGNLAAIQAGRRKREGGGNGEQPAAKRGPAAADSDSDDSDDNGNIPLQSHPVSSRTGKKHHVRHETSLR